MENKYLTDQAIIESGLAGLPTNAKPDSKEGIKAEIQLRRSDIALLTSKLPKLNPENKLRARKTIAYLHSKINNLQAKLCEQVAA